VARPKSAVAPQTQTIFPKEEGLYTLNNLQTAAKPQSGFGVGNTAANVSKLESVPAYQTPGLDAKKVTKNFNNANNGLWGKIKNGISGVGLADAANVIAPIASAFVGWNAANKMKGATTNAAQAPYQNFNTHVNVNPQIQASRRAVFNGREENNANTISSAARVSRNNAMENEGAYREAGIWANKENVEGELRNKEAGMRTTVDLHNAQGNNYAAIYNSQVHNQAEQMKAQSINAGISGVAAAGRDFVERRENRNMQEKAIRGLVAGDSANSAYKLAAAGVITDQDTLLNLYNNAPNDESKKVIYGLLDKNRRNRISA
jgi:hypothetical protein